MKKIGLFGGSFDPPHMGHVMTVNSVINKGLVDEVWLVPTGRHRDKDHFAPLQDRKFMMAILLSTMFQPRSPVKVHYGQMNQPHRISTSIDLLEELQRRFPTYQFSFVIGSDLIKQIPNWNAFDRLRKRGRFIFVPRIGHPIQQTHIKGLKATVIKELETANISSTIVRAAIQERKNLDGLIPPAVNNYIERHRLYLSPRKAIRKNDIDLLYEGRYLNLSAIDGWEYVARANCTGVVIIIAVTSDGSILLTEQYRIPVNKVVLEFPAGLINDESPKNETIKNAALRELLEETGYKANRAVPILEGPSSAGLTSEIVNFVFCDKLKKVSKGGGVGDENIAVRKVPLKNIDSWLAKAANRGIVIDPKVYVGLYFLNKLMV